ncbi:MAG: hypothetical protein ACRDLK_10050 [Gaiellaceae bacterium]
MAARPFDPVELDSLRSRWRAALLSADAALQATDAFLTPAARHELRKHLSDEYAPTAALLRELAHDEGSRPSSASPSCHYMPLLAPRSRGALRRPRSRP